MAAEKCSVLYGKYKLVCANIHYKSKYTELKIVFIEHAARPINNLTDQFFTITKRLIFAEYLADRLLEFAYRVFREAAFKPSVPLSPWSLAITVISRQFRLEKEAPFRALEAFISEKTDKSLRISRVEASNEIIRYLV